MKLKMRTTLGNADASRLDLHGAKEGDVVDASKEAAEELIAKQWAEEADKADEPRKVEAVPAPGLLTNPPVGKASGDKK